MANLWSDEQKSHQAIVKDKVARHVRRYVRRFSRGSGVSLINCDIFGCGKIGFSANYSSIEAENTVIRDCSEYIMGCSDTTATFNRCTFSGNGYKEPGNYAIEIYDFASESELSFSECAFDGNHNPELLNGISEESVTFDRCSFSGNAWDE